MNMWRTFRAKAAVALGIVMITGAIGGGGSAGLHNTASAAEEGPHDPEEVGRFFDEFFADPEISKNMAGAVVMVVKGDQVLAQKGYGNADTAKKLPVDPERTVFRIASVSKVITATAVMQLADQGKIDLNEDITPYLGGVRIPNKTNTPLTMKSLLTNSTGFDYGDTSELTSPDLKREVSLKSFIKANVPTVVKEPGKYYRYDNLGFTLQGYAVEQVAGQPFEEYVREHIFEPLGMTSSGFRFTPQINEQLAVPYDVTGKPIPQYATVPTVLPAGGMFSTGSDMAKFMMAHLNGGKLGDAKILDPASTAEMHRPQLAIHAKLPNMAYGFEYSNRQIYNGRYVVEKGGDMDGYHSGMWLLPEEKVGVYVNVNKDFDFRVPLFEAFMDHYYPEKTAAGELPPNTDQQSLKPFEGVYSDLRNRMWTTRVRTEGGLLIATDPLGEHRLRAIEPLLFEDENGVKAAFKLNDDNTVRAFYYDQKSDSWSQKMPEPRKYPDIGPDHPYAAYISHLRQLDIIGRESGEAAFRPEEPITRGEFIGWFIRWTGIAPSRQTPVFADIAGSPYAQEIQAAYEFGIIKGTGASKFHPSNPITREEAANLVWNMAAAYLHAAPMEAKLSGTTSPWALEGVRYVVAKGLYGPEIAGSPGSGLDYRSREPMLRQEAVALLSKFADNLY
ncbi:serine hydrolase [Paenibacillus macerans]|uniref:serine hydrolase n=1 Tax=Paenibacillus macerans TaxID=44252 RepID=UPI000EC1EB3F|nr:serine hydrolase [Paenibacillus macerans]GBK61667.1 penicillin-binding protein [Paenibacillus macerans]GBK67970.1 penicillin-binding protein [Paenibacillus macerans]